MSSGSRDDRFFEPLSCLSPAFCSIKREGLQLSMQAFDNTNNNSYNNSMNSNCIIQSIANTSHEFPIKINTSTHIQRQSKGGSSSKFFLDTLLQSQDRGLKDNFLRHVRQSTSDFTSFANGNNSIGLLAPPLYRLKTLGNRSKLK